MPKSFLAIRQDYKIRFLTNFTQPDKVITDHIE